MTRLHVHIAVADLDRNIAFYTALFGAGPTVIKPDYAKWQLDDPRVNFAISTHGRTPGMDHIGIQTDSAEELDAVHQRLSAAGIKDVDQPGAACCYARSDKYWTTDPQGIAWEAFHTLESVPMFGDAIDTAGEHGACCTPAAGECC